MAVRVMWASAGFAGGATNSFISASLAAFGSSIWALGLSDISGSLPTACTSQWPVEANEKAIDMSLARHYSDDFYHRVHIQPRSIDLGNIASEQVFPVTIWNAWLVPKTLANIETEDAEGFALSGQPAAPIVVAPLQTRVWSVRVGLDGPPTISATLKWSFIGGAIAALFVAGSRLIAFPFLPDWSTGVRERLEWMTEIMSSVTMREQRRCLRLSPRREFSVNLIVDGAERQYFDMLIFGWGPRIWALPVWHDIQITTAARIAGDLNVPCSTDGREFVLGGLALLRGATAWDVEVVEIQSVEPTKINLARPLAASWPRGTRIYPAVLGSLEQHPDHLRVTDSAESISAVFRVATASDSVGITPPTIYRGRPVLETAPDENIDLSRALERMTLMLDNKTGIPKRTDPSGQTFILQAHRSLLHGRAEHVAHRGLLYYLQGRFKALWVPSFADDLTVVTALVYTSPALTVRSTGYARFGITSKTRRDIRIELHDGTTFHRHIVAAAIIDAQTEQLEMDSPLDRNVSPGEVRRISYMTLCRLDQDAVEIQHDTDADGVAQSQFMLRGVKDDF